MKLDHIFCAIIGDIVHSRELSNRGEVQKQLEKSLTEVNEKYKPHISARFMISQGDEFQGLLETSESITDILDDLQTAMHPVHIRFGIGMGEVLTDIDEANSVRVDGPAYYLAREAVNEVRTVETRNGSAGTNVFLRVQNDEMPLNTANTLFSLMDTLRKGCTNRQNDVIRSYKEQQESQVLCAKDLGISQSAVNQHLKKSLYFSYWMAEQTVQEELDRIWRQVSHESNYYIASLGKNGEILAD